MCTAHAPGTWDYRQGETGWKLDAMSCQLRNAVTADEIKHMSVKYVRDWEAG